MGETIQCPTNQTSFPDLESTRRVEPAPLERIAVLDVAPQLGVRANSAIVAYLNAADRIDNRELPDPCVVTDMTGKVSMDGCVMVKLGVVTE